MEAKCISFPAKQFNNSLIILCHTEIDDGASQGLEMLSEISAVDYTVRETETHLELKTGP